MRSARFRRTRRAGAITLVSALTLTALAACGTSSSDDGGGSEGGSGSSDPAAPLDPKTKVTITIDCMPPKAKAAELKEWQEDVKEFNKTYPNVTIEGRSTPGQCLEPPRFTAMLKAKSQPDVFYTYFTDLPQVLDNDGAEDITAYVNDKTVPALGDIDPNVLGSLKHENKLYGLPTSNYTMGLLINRKLFEQAGLDPDSPPRTWDEVRTAAKKIAGLGDGIAGFGEYSAGNTGGWHFTAQMYSRGSDVVDESGKKATFNNEVGKEVAENLHAMRWEDESMGKTQLLKWGDLQKQIATDKLGMFLAAPDDITYMVQQLGADYENFGMGPIPGAKNTLAGGNNYMIKKGISPDKIKAGVAWLNFQNLTVGEGQFNWARKKTDKLPVGLPQPNFWLNESKKKDDAARLEHATMPVENFKSFMDNPVPGLAEPPKAQEVYKVLDNVMSGLLTNEDADVDKLLSTAEQQVNQVLATQ
ncbi:extracellular solute-binding protein [Streptomyces violaceoruber]|uniref:Sugar-binding lipoprotein n=8 Tax=Streptomyces TaxID=1883 RepID=Q7AKD7_STRCO|nr:MULTISPECIES: extracellular solute-binding protein [Streptomyces]AAC46447.1 sugar binding lipoprotein precursor [Streptomyces lividans]AIJ11859.1 sugar-binding lipoprotein [Streptomyces lividans TK24]EFD65197.1 sugar-binding lipoprotein [Streptomyces lividans TK24]EOY51919.1 sugar uptake ABC transporter sugar-binding protein [Streptomyces lividans 1326]KKD10193.1 sugar-binding protein [Streptomyces sp. WM6391]